MQQQNQPIISVEEFFYDNPDTPGGLYQNMI
jgi:hypothetical protein